MDSKELIKNIYVVIEENHMNYERVFKGRLSGISKIINIWKKSGAAWSFLYDKCKLPIDLSEDGNILIDLKDESNPAPIYFAVGSAYLQYSSISFSSILRSEFRKRRSIYYVRIENRFIYRNGKTVEISLYFKIKRDLDTLVFDVMPIEDEELNGIQDDYFVRKYHYRLFYFKDKLELTYGHLHLERQGK